MSRFDRESPRNHPHNNMSAKKLINSPDKVVDEALEGLTMIHPGLRLLEATVWWSGNR